VFFSLSWSTLTPYGPVFSRLENWPPFSPDCGGKEVLGGATMGGGLDVSFPLYALAGSHVLPLFLGNWSPLFLTGSVGLSVIFFSRSFGNIISRKGKCFFFLVFFFFCGGLPQDLLLAHEYPSATS